MKNKIYKAFIFVFDIIITYLFFMLMYISFSFLIIGDPVSIVYLLGSIFSCIVERIIKKDEG